MNRLFVSIDCIRQAMDIVEADKNRSQMQKEKIIKGLSTATMVLNNLGVLYNKLSRRR